MSPSAQESLRLRAVTALVAGRTREDVATAFQVSLKAVDNWWAKWLAGRPARSARSSAAWTPGQQTSGSRLLREPMYLVAPATDRSVSGAHADLADHRNRRWIAGCERCRTHLLAACAERGFTPEVGFETDDHAAVQALVAAGLGLSTLPGLALRAHLSPRVRVHFHPRRPPLRQCRRLRLPARPVPGGGVPQGTHRHRRTAHVVAVGRRLAPRPEAGRTPSADTALGARQ